MNRMIHHLPQFFTFAKVLKTSGYFVLFSGFLLIYMACGKKLESDKEPFLNIIDGQFEIEAVLSEGDSNSIHAPPSRETLLRLSAFQCGALSGGPQQASRGARDLAGAGEVLSPVRVCS